MADVALPERPALAVIPDVELLHVGEEWPLASDGTENGTFTPEDLAAAVAAQDDPSVRSPVIKFGHNGDRPPAFGAPVWGRVTNLRLADEGMTLVGDYTGVPVWLAEILPSAWPSRSIEGKRNHTSDVGRSHDLVITAVSLLGVELPAISTLDDVQAVWSARTPEEAHVTLKEATVPDTTAARRTATIAAGITTEDIRRAYYDNPVAGVWSWIREIELDPLTLIVDDEEGGLFRVPVTVSGTEVTFGKPEPVRVEYVAAAATSASRGEQDAIVFASRNESREGVAGMDVAQLRKALNLGDDVSDEDVVAQAAAKLTVPPEGSNTNTNTPPGDQGTGTGAADTGDQATGDQTGTSDTGTGTGTGDADAGDADSVRISKAVLDQLQADAAMGVAAAKRQAKDDEDAFIKRHRRRLGPATNPAAGRLEASWRREFRRNPGEAEALAASHAVVVPTEAHGHEGGADVDGDAASGWSEAELRAFPELRTQGGN